MTVSREVTPPVLMMAGLKQAMQYWKLLQQFPEYRKEVKDMSEKEKKALETITKALPQMNDFQKGYLIGMGEAMGEQNKKENEKSERGNGSTGNSITN